VDLTQGNIALIASGISVGDSVVVDGQERLQAGTPVEVHNASSGGGSGTGSGGGADAAAKDPDKAGKKKDKKQGKQS
jgi:multidrug efflux system membrane fusion protein